MSPSIKPPPTGTRWRITITELTPDGQEDTFLDLEGQAYIVAAANIHGTRIITDIDHNDANELDLDLRQRILARIIDTIDDASAR